MIFHILRLCSTYQLADIISKYLPDGSSKKEKRTRPSKTQKAKNYPTGSYYKVTDYNSRYVS